MARQRLDSRAPARACVGQTEILKHMVHVTRCAHRLPMKLTPKICVCVCLSLPFLFASFFAWIEFQASERGAKARRSGLGGERHAVQLVKCYTGKRTVIRVIWHGAQIYGSSRSKKCVLLLHVRPGDPRCISIMVEVLFLRL